MASLVLRENVVALTVLWLLNIGEYLQDLTLRRSRRAISELLTGAQTRAWIRLADGTELEVDIDQLGIGDQVVVHEHVVLPVDGVIVEGEGIVDQAAITGEQLPITVAPGRSLYAGTVVLRGRLVVRASAVGRTARSGASSTGSSRPSRTGRRSRPWARTSPAASCPRRSRCRRSRCWSPVTSGAP